VEPSRFGSFGLGRKLLLLLATVLCLATAASIALFFPLFRHELTNESRIMADRLGQLLGITLENAMLKRDIEGLRDMVDGLAAVEGVSSVRILDRDLNTRFGRDPQPGGEGARTLEALCPGCPIEASPAGSGTRLVAMPDGSMRLRSVRAIANREPCAGCHGDAASNPVNGYLVVEYDAGPARARAWNTAALVSVGAVVITLLALMATWFALRRLVLAPAAGLHAAVRAVTAGDLAARAPVAPGSPDEMAALARGFNGMADRLSATMAELRERDAFLQGVIDAVPDGIRVIASDFAVIAVNDRFCRQVGLSRSEILGRPCYASSHGRAEPCVPTLVVCPLVELGIGGSTVKCTHVHRCGAEDVAVEVVAASVPDGRPGQAGRCIVESIREVSHDVAVSLGDRLSEIGQLATGVAHEIHNPLASVQFGLTAVQACLGQADRMDEAKEYMELVRREIERCIDVTGRLMRLSEGPSERGALVDVGEVAQGIASLLRYEAETRRIALTVDIAASTRIIASESEIGMVLVNLIQNAFHATAAGGRITVSGGAGPGGEVTITVADTGRGIPTEDLARIFLPFWTRRADRSEGSGLGLPICKALVGKWRGTISVTSRQGEGTTFHLVFPSPDAVLDAA